jgi:hypothetical protein
LSSSEEEKRNYKFARNVSNIPPKRCLCILVTYIVIIFKLGDIVVIENTTFIVVKKTFKTALSLENTCDWIKIYPRGTLNQLKYYVSYLFRFVKSKFLKTEILYLLCNYGEQFIKQSCTNGRV